MTQCVEDPTRFSPDDDSHSVIDVYATNHPDLVTAINVSDPISDHCVVTTHLREPRPQRKHKRNESSSSDGSFPSTIVPNFRNVDWHGLRVHLLTSPLLEAIQGTDNVICAAAVWESMFVEILQWHIPNCYIRHRPKNKVWMTFKPFPLPEKQPIFDFLPIPELTVLRTLQHLPISKATAHPLITNRVLRECAPIICPSITHLCNLSITTGVFPDAWKRATVTPIFKNRGTAGDPSNYRPVSLLPAMGKVLDRIQSSCLLQHLVQHNLISPHQFGFIPGKSTTLQLVYLFYRWLQALEKGHNIAAVFLDFKKAFDSVWHHGLLHKLLTCGISPHKSVTWIPSYLTNRQISVKVRNTFSEFQPITRGVPQGSHLAQYFSLCSSWSMTLFHLWPSRLKAMPMTRHYISNTRKRRTSCQSYL